MFVRGHSQLSTLLLVYNEYTSYETIHTHTHTNTHKHTHTHTHKHTHTHTQTHTQSVQNQMLIYIMKNVICIVKYNKTDIIMNYCVRPLC